MLKLDDFFCLTYKTRVNNIKIMVVTIRYSVLLVKSNMGEMTKNISRSI